MEDNIKFYYEYANAGYKVVMAPASHSYFDHPADASPNEPGFYWACRFNDVLKTFSFRPMQFYANADYKRYGAPYQPGEVCEEITRCPKLEKPENIIGLEGCLWSETMRNPEMLIGQIFPRLIALADRAFYERSFDMSDKTGTVILRDEGFRTEWESFKVTAREVLRELRSKLTDFPARLPVVGIQPVDEVNNS